MRTQAAVVNVDSLHDESDERLIELARRGDRYAQSRLLVRYRQRVVRIAYGMLHSVEDAEDAAQETFVSVFRSLTSYQGKSKFFSWLYRIVVNICINRQRSRPAEISTENIPEQQIEGCAESTVLSISVQVVMAKLPPQQRAVLVLKEMEQLTYSEIAEVMQIAEGTVKFHVSEARRNFRRIWLQEFGDEM